MVGTPYCFWIIQNLNALQNLTTLTHLNLYVFGIRAPTVNG